MLKQTPAKTAERCAGAQTHAANGGFTLIELMIVVAIVAILAAVAYPSYTAQIVRGQRSTGQNFIMDLAQREEQYFLDNRAYTNVLANLGYAAVPPQVAPLYAAPAFVLVAGPPAGYTISLAPLAGTRLAQTNDGTLLANNLSQRWREVDGNQTFGANDCTFEDATCRPQ
jgi:type IV pilus assembly protein PilE